MQQFIDIHCHCLPGLDDGPTNMADTFSLCRALVEDGIVTVVATPHQLGRFEGNIQAPLIRKAVDQLNRQLKESGILLTVLPGSEIRVDERICRLLQDDVVLTLADCRRHVLLELPYEIFIDIEPLLRQLDDLGIIAVISHPERQKVLAAQPEIVSKWSDFGVGVHITSGSILGLFGSAIQKAAWNFLNADCNCVVATDAHDTSCRGPVMTAAFELITQKLGKDAARKLCIENPSRIIEGKDICK